MEHNNHSFQSNRQTQAHPNHIATNNSSSNPSFSDYDLSIHTVQEEQPINEPSPNNQTITQESLANQQFELSGLIRFKSDNDKVINELLRQRQQSFLIEDKKVCIESICLEDCREVGQGEHECHKIMQLKSLLKELDVLKCNYQFTLSSPQQVISLLNSLDMVYHEILRFEQQITGLFSQLKLNAYQHIKTIKDSFSFKYFQQVKGELLQDFSYANIRFALQEIEKFKKVHYPNLQYPNLKIQTMKTTLQEINLDHKIHIIERTNKWIQKLYARDKHESRIRKNRSILSFMNMTPSQKSVFSHYMKSHEYALTHKGKVLQRTIIGDDFVPFAVIQKQLARETTTIKIKVERMDSSIFIGFAPLEELHKCKYQNIVKSSYAHFITNNGRVLPLGTQNSNLKSIPFEFAELDIISIIRTNHLISFVKNMHLKNQQRFDVHLSPEEYLMNLYPCLHLSSTSSVVRIVK